MNGGKKGGLSFAFRCRTAECVGRASPGEGTDRVVQRRWMKKGVPLWDRWACGTLGDGDGL